MHVPYMYTAEADDATDKVCLSVYLANKFIILLQFGHS